MAKQLITDRYAIYNGDCIKAMKKLPDESVHLSLYSPPFGGLMYQYSSDPEDLSNTKDYAEFMEHYGYVVREIHRLTMPGRMTAVHTTDLFQSNGLVHSIKDFPGDVVKLHEENGWAYVARIHIWKEPLTVRNRTMLKSLHHATLVEDSTLVSIANADYLLVFRRSGQNPVPVAHPIGLTSYAGTAEPPVETLEWKGYKGNQIKNAYSQWIWRQYASSNWHDIRIDNTLGGGASLYSNNRAEKDESDEKHMHPLQLDVIERAVVLWTNPGETVLTPFLGIGSEVYQAVKMGRRGIGMELKPSYFRQAIDYLKTVDDVKVDEQTEADEANIETAIYTKETA